MPTIVNQLLANGRQQYLDGAGNPLSGGSVSYYIPETLTPKTVWADPYADTVVANPVDLDANGECVIYGSGQYRQIVKDLNDVTIWDELTYGLAPQSSAPGFGTQATIASAATTNIGQFDSHNVLITGTATIGSFGNSADLDAPVFLLQFDNAATISAGASILTPGSVDILAASGDSALVQFLGAGVWRVMAYWHAGSASQGGFGAQQSLASAATTDLGTKTSNNVLVTGVVAITSFGSSANTSNPVYLLEFAGILTLTYDATALKLPGSASITTAAGDCALAQYHGSGHWTVEAYWRKSGHALIEPTNGTLPIGIVGAVKNLYINAKATGGAATLDVSYDELNIEDASGNILRCPAFTGTDLAISTYYAPGLAANTWYSVWRIGKPDGTLSFAFGASGGAPVIADATYTFKARLGWARMSAATNSFLLSTQRGRTAFWKAARLAVSGVQGDPAVPTWIATALGAFIPPDGAGAYYVSMANGYNGGGNAHCQAAPLNSYGTIAAATPPPLYLDSGAKGALAAQFAWFPGDANVYFASDAAGGALFLLGWDDIGS